MCGRKCGILTCITKVVSWVRTCTCNGVGGSHTQQSVRFESKADLDRAIARFKGKPLNGVSVTTQWMPPPFQGTRGRGHGYNHSHGGNYGTAKHGGGNQGGAKGGGYKGGAIKGAASKSKGGYQGKASTVGHGGHLSNGQRPHDGLRK
jgi:hypothetical protein